MTIGQVVKTDEGAKQSSVHTERSVLYDPDGKVLALGHEVMGEIALSDGLGTVNLLRYAAFRKKDSYVCTFGNNTATRPVAYTRVSGSRFTLKGTEGDVISFHCWGE